MVSVVQYECLIYTHNVEGRSSIIFCSLKTIMISTPFDDTIHLGILPLLATKRKRTILNELNHNMIV
jgi:hypothetical protein